MENNAKVYKKIKEKEGHYYVNYYVEVNGVEFAVKPCFDKDKPLMSRVIRKKGE